jgi:hypothetical protein
MEFWDFVVFVFWCYVFIAYLMILFAILGDLFRDGELNGWLKALWVIFLIFLPFLTALVYLIARGRGMTERHVAAMEQSRSQTDSYIRSVASSSPADEIAKAKALLDSGSITEAEFASIKRRAMSGSQQPAAA